MDWSGFKSVFSQSVYFSVNKWMKCKIRERESADRAVGEYRNSKWTNKTLCSSYRTHKMWEAHKKTFIQKHLTTVKRDKLVSLQASRLWESSWDGRRAVTWRTVPVNWPLPAEWGRCGRRPTASATHPAASVRSCESEKEEQTQEPNHTKPPSTWREKKKRFTKCSKITRTRSTQHRQHLLPDNRANIRVKSGHEDASSNHKNVQNKHMEKTVERKTTRLHSLSANKTLSILMIS